MNSDHHSRFHDGRIVLDQFWRILIVDADAVTAYTIEAKSGFLRRVANSVKDAPGARTRSQQLRSKIRYFDAGSKMSPLPLVDFADRHRPHQFHPISIPTKRLDISAEELARLNRGRQRRLRELRTLPKADNRMARSIRPETALGLGTQALHCCIRTSGGKNVHTPIDDLRDLHELSNISRALARLDCRQDGRGIVQR